MRFLIYTVLIYTYKFILKNAYNKLLKTSTRGIRWRVASESKQPIARATMVERRRGYHHWWRISTIRTPITANALRKWEMLVVYSLKHVTKEE